MQLGNVYYRSCSAGSYYVFFPTLADRPNWIRAILEASFQENFCWCSIFHLKFTRLFTLNWICTANHNYWHNTLSATGRASVFYFVQDPRFKGMRKHLQLVLTEEFYGRLLTVALTHTRAETLTPKLNKSTFLQPRRCNGSWAKLVCTKPLWRGFNGTTSWHRPRTRKRWCRDTVHPV